MDSSSSSVWYMLGCANSELWIWAQDISKLVSFLALLLLHSGAGSPGTHPNPQLESDLPCCLGEMLGLFSKPQLMRDGDSSLAIRTPSQVSYLPQTLRGKGGGRRLSFVHVLPPPPSFGGEWHCKPSLPTFTSPATQILCRLLS